MRSVLNMEKIVVVAKSRLPPVRVPHNYPRSPLIMGYRLHSLTSSEGRIRLSEDDGPPASEFIADDSDDDQNEQPNAKISRNIPRQRPGLGGTQTVIPESESA